MTEKGERAVQSGPRLFFWNHRKTMMKEYGIRCKSLRLVPASRRVGTEYQYCLGEKK